MFLHAQGARMQLSGLPPSLLLIAECVGRWQTFNDDDVATCCIWEKRSHAFLRLVTGLVSPFSRRHRLLGSSRLVGQVAFTICCISSTKH